MTAPDFNDFPQPFSRPQPVPSRAFSARLAHGFMVYARWLEGLSWGRFVLGAVLLVAAAGMLSHLPPFSWRLGPAAAVDSTAKVVIKIDTGRGGVHVERVEPAPPAEPDAPEVSLELGDGGDDQALREGLREAVDSVNEELRNTVREERAQAVTLGDYLPDFALLFVLCSATIKAMMQGRVRAERKVAAAEAAVEAESLRRQLLEARLAALQAQVEPHFLFNTLASIEHLIETDPPRAGRMQRNLIAMLRAAMPRLRQGPGNLARELDLVRPYLEILKMRMESRLEVELAIPAGLLSAEFPPLALQPLVENAIRHGLEPKPEGGRLSIGAEVRDGRLEVCVADSGLGFGAAPTGGTGVGLANLRERLHALYGSQAELRVSGNAPCGTRVMICLPYRAGGASPL